MKVALLVLAASLSSLATGCIYARHNLDLEKGVYKNYPQTLEEEQARRSKRRKHALIAAPLEMAGGVGIAALALFAKSTPMDDGNDSVVDNLGDAGKELAGRLLMAGVGGAIAISGVGDLVLALVDPAHDSPLVRDGALVGADRIDLIAPPRSPRFVITAGNVLGTHGVGADLGIGLAHWVDDRIRLRHTVSGNYRVWFDRTDGGVTFETAAELAFGRVRGLYPRKSIGLFGGGGWWWNGDHDPVSMNTYVRSAPAITGGFLAKFSVGQYRLGTRYTPGLDRYPSIDFTSQFEIGGD